MAVLDPALTSTRPVRPVVAVLGPEDRATDVVGALQRRFSVIRGASDAASATILVGEAPDELHPPAGPVFVVRRRSARPELRITRVDMPRRILRDHRVPADIALSVTGAMGRSLEIELRAGDVRADLATVPVSIDSGTIIASVPVIPGAGTQLVRVTARVSGERLADSAFAQVNVGDERLPVLFFDARPSWNSTFVRRAVEQDPRFSLAYRIQTSRGLFNTGGTVPWSLRDAESLRDFAVIVVGAPDLLTTTDLTGLESFMRRRGGRVVLLAENSPDAAVNRFVGVLNWRVLRSGQTLSLTSDRKQTLLRARDITWPATLPTGAAMIASSRASDSSSRAVVWSVPVGAGRLIVSGARDAWHYRGDSAGFDAFWRSTIAEQALQAHLPVDIALSRQPVRPGEEVVARVVLRDVFLADEPDRSARVSAVFVSGTETTSVRLLPDHMPGVFNGRITAPRNQGLARLVVQADGEHGEAPIVVDPGAFRPRAGSYAVLEAFVSSRGGRVIDERDLNTLPDILASAVRLASRVETWHPMRSSWWIVPFALLLGIEWWWRRRHGQA